MQFNVSCNLNSLVRVLNMNLSGKWVHPKTPVCPEELPYLKNFFFFLITEPFHSDNCILRIHFLVVESKFYLPVRLTGKWTLVWFSVNPKGPEGGGVKWHRLIHCVWIPTPTTKKRYSASAPWILKTILTPRSLLFIKQRIWNHRFHEVKI